MLPLTSRAPRAKVALFDMDRTLVNQHTAKLYIKYLRDSGEMGAVEALRMGYWLFRYTIGAIDAEAVATKVLVRYKGKESEWLHERCRRWFEQYVRSEVSQLGRECVEAHLSRGTSVALATTAIRHGAQPLADALRIPHVVCSELEEVEGVLTGGFCQPLCYGQGKLELAERWIQSLGVSMSQVAFYTDSITDLPLLERVGFPIVINPDLRLKRTAEKKGWPVDNWKDRRST